MKSLTALFLACTALAAWAMSEGNPTAVNGVVGAGLCTLVCGSLALIDRY